MLHKTAKLNCSITDSDDDETILAIGRALSVPERLNILRLLNTKPMNLLEISKQLEIPTSSVSNHISVLVDAQLVGVKFQPAKKGHMKLCYKRIMNICIDYPDLENKNVLNSISVDMPVGNYTDISINNSGYLTGSDGYIFEKDQISSLLYTPNRVNAQLLGFVDGYVCYNFPNYFVPYPTYNELELSFECCSEAPYYRNEWPSDITLWLNDIEVDTLTSPGDFGGRMGNYSPQYWPINATQYGLLYKFLINDEGCFLNDKLINKNLTLQSIIKSENFIKLKFGFKPDAEHKGGLNLFGKNFGDYPQGIVMKFNHKIN